MLTCRHALVFRRSCQRFWAVARWHDSRPRAEATTRRACSRRCVGAVVMNTEGHMQRFGIFLFVMLLSTTAFLNANDKTAHDRTPWGDPDLQGVFSNQTPTPLERPDALAGKATLSEEEAAQFEKTSLERLLTTV